MSFLSGILSIGKSAIGFLSGGGIASSLVKTALLGLAVNKLSKSATKANTLGNTANIDQGVRLQVKPDATAKIPVLYGSAFFGGNITDAAMTNSNKTMWYCLALTEKTGGRYSDSASISYTLNNVYWNDQRIIFNADGITANYTVDRSGNIDRSISGLVKVYFYAGGRTAGQLPSGYTGTAPANAETLFPNWTSGTHAMSNVVFALVRVDYNREKSVTGIGDMNFNLTTNVYLPGDVLYDFLTNTRYGAGIASTDIDTATITALNTYSAESVAYADQGTGAQTLADRYQINGLLDTADPVLQNAEKILNAAASWLSYDTHEGKWSVIINKAGTSVASFTDSNIIGNITLGGTGLQDLYNAVKVEFPHRQLRDSADFYKIEIAAGDRNSNEEDNTLNISYDIINEPIQAQMLGLIELKQSRIDLMIQFRTDFGQINLNAGDLVDVTNSRFGFSSKVFRIISITEVQETDGALVMDITALEYDSNVYSVADLYRFTRSDANGIITIGSVGTPGTPTVTKIEQDSRPRVVIESTAPTGVVEGLEFWLTTNVSEADDTLRSYSLIATQKPVGGGVYTSGTTVSLDYDSLGATNFYIKTRGFNTTAVGSFSAPSGLTEFDPVQVTNAIDADTKAFDSTGALLGSLALVNLLSKLSDLFGSGDGAKSLFERIFEVFNDETGVDLVGQASGGDLVVASDLELKASGSSLGATTTSIDFIGPIEASGSGDIEVKLKDGLVNKDILAWNAADGEWQIISGCVTCNFVDIVPEGVEEGCFLEVNTLLPADRGSLVASTCETEYAIPYTGSYFAKFTINPGYNKGTSVKAGSFATGTRYTITRVGTTDFTLIGASANTLGVVFTATGPGTGNGYAAPRGTQKTAIQQYASLVKGTGNAYLYSTDGNLVQTISAANLKTANDVVEFPFNAREPGKDYYIRFDDGIVSSCTCENTLVDNATTWNFTTSQKPVAPYSYSSILGSLTAYNPSGPTFNNRLQAVSYTPTGLKCVGSAGLSITFNENISAGTGSVIITDRLTGTTVGSYNISAATISGATANWETIGGLTANKSYNVTAPEGLVQTARTATTQTLCDASKSFPAGPTLTSDEVTFGFSTDKALEFVSIATCPAPTGNAKCNTNLVLTFNKNIGKKASGPAYVYIFEADGNLHQKINLNATYAADKTAVISSVSGTTLTLNPTRLLEGATNYYINIDADALTDSSCATSYAGIDDSTTITFRTDGVETVAPTGPTYSSVLLYWTFDRPITLGTGKINVLTSSGQLLTQIANTDSVLEYSNTPFTE